MISSIYEKLTTHRILRNDERLEAHPKIEQNMNAHFRHFLALF